LAGEWERAEQELLRATGELAAYQAAPPLADGFFAIGEIRLHTGDLAGAEDAIRQAHAFGHSPDPVLSLIRLAEGKTRVALASITAAVEQQTWDRWARARLLPAQVEIAVAAGDAPLARRAAEELDALVESYVSPALDARRREAFARVLVLEGDHARAVQEARSAIERWREVGAPYEVARCRVVLSTALRALDDAEAADLELGAARDEFARLGAEPDAAAAERAIRDAAERKAAPTPSRKTFLFTDIVGSTTLAETLGDQSWEVLLRWHDDALRGAFARGGGEVVNSTGDGFFVAFDAAPPAIACAIAIQRALADHRRASGFALSVRIGAHTAVANRRGDDYSGVGVHVAARVAALAGAGEIVASLETMEGIADVVTSEARDIELKGVNDAVEVVWITWQV
jgi:class 3 adenylate cyclase